MACQSAGTRESKFARVYDLVECVVGLDLHFTFRWTINIHIPLVRHLLLIWDGHRLLMVRVYTSQKRDRIILAYLFWGLQKGLRSLAIR